MVDASLSDRLRRFGLSDKEIDTYLTLLQHGEAKPSEVAKDADISKRYVYSVSEELEEKGFVEVNSHAVPTTIRAYSPDEVIEGLQNDIESMRPGLMELYTEPEPTDEQIEVIKSKVTIFKRIRRLMQEAEDEIALSIPENYLDEVKQELQDAVDRGVLVVVVVTDTEAAPDSEIAASILRQWDEVMPTILAVDSERGVFAPTELLLRSTVDRQGIMFVQEQLGPAIVGSFFGNYWPMTEEVRVPEPAPLPQTYTSFRHATLQAYLHNRAGTSFIVEVSGRRTVGEGEPVTVSGTVADIRQGLIRPITNEFPIEHSFTIDTGETTVSVGGPGAFVEDIEAGSVTLKEA